MMLRVTAFVLAFFPILLVADEGVFTTRSNAKQELVPLPKEDGVFHFVIYGDRTGGPVEGINVLRQAVRDTNLLDPDLVMTVGDLINGYNTTPQWMMQMKEYRGAMSKLRMPWFPVAGNHDIYWRGPEKPPGDHERDYELHFGPLWYAFQHKNAGFIAMFSDEGDPATGEKAIAPGFQNVSPEQLEFLKQALERLESCDHVFVFLHHPRWLDRGPYKGSNWNEVHRLLVEAGNVSAVFGGHIHQMTYAGKKDGIEYFTLSSVGANLRHDLPPAGFLHHINVVTVRKDSFQVAAIPVGETIDPREFTIERIGEIGDLATLPIGRKTDPIVLSRQATRGTYTLEVPNPTSRPIEVVLDSTISGPGWRFLPDHQHFTVPPGETKTAAFRYRFEHLPEYGDFSRPALSLQIEYLAETARVPLPTRQIDIDVALSRDTRSSTVATADRALRLMGKGAIRVPSRLFELPDGPFTVEAWVKPSQIDGEQGLVAKTQTSEYSLFLSDGLPDFSVHLDGRYVSVVASERLPKGVWTHVAGVFNGEELVLFVGGKPVKRVAASGTRRTNKLPLYLGADPGERGERTRPFVGSLDEVRISVGARYRDAFEPDRHFDADATTTLHYDFDEPIGPFVVDRSKNKAVAELSGEAHVVPVE